MAATYTVSAGGQTLVNAVVTLLFIRPSATQSLQILRCWVTQSATATAAMQRIQIVTQVSAFGTFVTATPRAHDTWSTSQIVGGTAGAAGTVGVNASAEGGGTRTVRYEDAFQNTIGWFWRPVIEDEIWTLQANATLGFGLYFPVAAGTLTNWSFGISFRET